MNHDSESAGLAPGQRVQGAVTVPGSKSVAQRALLLAALGPAGTRLRGELDGADVRQLLASLNALDLGPTPDDDGCMAWPSGPTSAQPRSTAPGPIGVGESGTAARLWTALVGLGCLGQEARELDASGTLLDRRSPALLTCLRRAGARIHVHHPARGDFPLALAAVPRLEPESVLLLDHPSSSQEVTGLLLGLALGTPSGGASRPGLDVRGPIPSQPYVSLTCRLLERFRCQVAVEREGERTGYRLTGALRPPAEILDIEPDASAAAVALAAGCLSGGRVHVAGLDQDSVQGDVAIVDHLRAFGCEAGFGAGGVWATGFPPQGARVDLEGEPDLAPVLAAVAAGAALRGGGTSLLSGLATLAGKESDRIQVLTQGLRAVGFEVVATGESLHIGAGPGDPPKPTLLDPHGDHRMAFSFALLGLLVPGVRVANPACVAKSWPGFWTSLANASVESAP